MDTTNILFIAGGAFSGLVDIIRRRTETRTMGFGADVVSRKDVDVGEVLQKVEYEDLLKFGLIPEFIGRFPVVATLDGLGEAELRMILTEPKNALTKQFARLFEMDGVELVFDEEAIDEIARRAIKVETGARSLRSIMEGFMTNIMFELPTRSNRSSVCRITPEVVTGDAEPIYLEREDKKTA